jgi:hypothetical protein
LKSSRSLSSSFVTTTDVLGLPDDYIPLAYFSDLELNIGVACFCMPAVRVVIRRYFPNCGIATTSHDTDSVYGNGTANNQPRHIGHKASHKSANSKTGHSATISGSSIGKYSRNPNGPNGGAPKAKMPGFVNIATKTRRPETQDSDSDQVELRPYAGDGDGHV